MSSSSGASISPAQRPERKRRRLDSAERGDSSSCPPVQRRSLRRAASARQKQQPPAAEEEEPEDPGEGRMLLRQRRTRRHLYQLESDDEEEKVAAAPAVERADNSKNSTQSNHNTNCKTTTTTTSISNNSSSSVIPRKSSTSPASDSDAGGKASAQEEAPPYEESSDGAVERCGSGDDSTSDAAPAAFDSEYEEEEAACEPRRRSLARSVRATTVTAGKSPLEALLEQSDHFTAKLLAQSLSGRRPRDSAAELLDEQTAPTRLTQQPALITGGTLKPYQLEGLNWLIHLHESGLNGILADEMGLGKTFQTISLLAFLREFKGISGPHLILCPKSTLGNWHAEIRRFCPALRAFKFHGAKEERAQLIADGWLKGARTDIVITSFELCMKEQAAFRKIRWQYIIVDEAHRIKNEGSKLSVVIRQFRTRFRLLLTGTPLQNNLRELWALLNFLFPEMFASGEEFERLFDLMSNHHEDGRLLSAEEKTARNAAIVQRLHKILKPFLLRRVKSEVMVELPPKKELLLYVPLSSMQRGLYRTLLARNVDAMTEAQSGGKYRLLNLAMQLRKACNHPYLFDGYEDKTQDAFGEHLVNNSGKMLLLDRMLQRLIGKGSRVLIFTQMTSMLDILEDYCRMRQFLYCRIDGSTAGDDRERQLEAFNAPDSPLKVFLLSTRAGGLGINLATADTVVIYDSDWNPQVDLQAMDRAHRIGQRKPVSVFRLVHEHTIEEKVIERALLKLRLDTVVIQHGRLSSQAGGGGGHQAAAAAVMSKTDLMRMVQYGADKIYQSKELSELSESDVDGILERGERRTAELSGKLDLHANRLSLLNFDVANSSLYEFEGVDYNQQKERAAWAELGVAQLEDERAAKRRVRVVQEQQGEIQRQQQQQQQLQLQAAAQAANASSPSPLIDRKGRIRLLRMEEWQFFERGRITALHEIEVNHVLSGGVTPDLTDEEREEKVRLFSEGFGNWSRKDFLAFIRACELHGSNDIRAVARDVGKPEEEVERYSQTFHRRYAELLEGDKFMKRVLAGNDVAAKHRACAAHVIRRLNSATSPWFRLNQSFPKAKTQFSDEEDRWLLNAAVAVGYGDWEALQRAANSSPTVMFNWLLRSRTGADLAKRVDFLAKQLQKEQQDETATRSRAAARTSPAQTAAAGATPQDPELPAAPPEGDPPPLNPCVPFPPPRQMYASVLAVDTRGSGAKVARTKRKPLHHTPSPPAAGPTPSAELQQQQIANIHGGAASVPAAPPSEAKQQNNILLPAKKEGCCSSVANPSLTDNNNCDDSVDAEEDIFKRDVT